MRRALISISAASVAAQQAGKLQGEVHPQLWMEVDCSESGCRFEKNEVVLDANWRWVNKDGTNCYRDDSTWDPATCSSGEECAKTCAVEGADYASSYGVTTNSYQDGVNLKFVTVGQYSKNFGSRLYVMDSPDTYKMFKLKNREFTFTVDVSNLPCGLNGALYFVEMDSRGNWDGLANTAGAKYGTGYCDAQCPHDIKFIKGAANVDEWDSQAIPPVGKYGACCTEMDIWEANRMSTAFTPHTCAKAGLHKCGDDPKECGDNSKGERYMGVCDKDGCDFNSYRMGDTSFYGHGSDFKVDTSKPVTVVTQFLTSDGTDGGDLSEIRRFYVQDGKVVPNSEASILGGGNSVTDSFCAAQKEKFGDPDDFTAKGGLKAMGEALDRGMVLVLSLWDDTDVHMLWLDSAYPTGVPPRKPGVLRGPCPGGEDSAPSSLRARVPDSSVEYSQFKVGAIGSTFINPGRRLHANNTHLV